MVGALDLVPAIPLLPLASFVIALLAAVFAPKALPKGGALPGIAALGGSLALSGWAALSVGDGRTVNETLYTWVSGQGADAISLHFGVLIDPLSAMMAIIVSLIALLVFVFSLGYMNAEGETGLPRYYASLSLFSFSMLAFVVADNLLMAFMFFELVGLCSWLLIGFWFREEGPPSGAKKAFLVTRFGDYFFLVGVVAVFATFGTALFAEAGSQAGFPQLAADALLEGNADINTFLGLGEQAWLSVVGLLVLGGVIGKSAQFPLHTWLPDAMEGPTPVSALIHAATMVAAGVYLVARMYGFYALLPEVLAVIAFVGGFTALVAATMGVVKNEIKQVLAYSTISQYGYMMLALGTGGYVAATFHLLTHAIFKALLFLGAGAVIIAMHHNENMWDMGGLRKRMRVTYLAFLSGSLALAGIIPFSGFWSKDEVLYEALAHGLGGSPLLLAAWAMGLLAVFFTGYYTFRMVGLTFGGEARTDAARSPHGVGWVVKGPLAVLGVLAATVGFLNMVPVKKVTGANIDYLHQWLDGPITETSVHYYAGEEGLLHEAAGYTVGTAGLGETTLALLSGAVALVLALAGAGLAWRRYAVPDPAVPERGSLGTVVYNNYYQDEYQVWLAERVTLPLARAADTFDQFVVDGVVNGVSSVSLAVGSRLRRIQSGVVTNYAALLTLGLVVLLVVFGVAWGWF
jgi:NADH-quinone oxidoreductase subunit L